MGVEGVLLAVDRHPLGHQRPAAADDARQCAARHSGTCSRKTAAMDGHVIDALPGLLGHHVEKMLRPHVGNVVELLGHLVDGHGADRAPSPRR